MKIEGKIYSVSGIRAFNGDKQVGFTLDKEPTKWYNVFDAEESLENLRQTILQKGNKVSFDLNEGKVSYLTLLEKAEKEKSNEHTSFEDLLSDAHKKFPDKIHIRTEVVRNGAGDPLIDIENKYAVFKAQVYIKDDDNNVRVFEGHGDTTKNNVGKMVEDHFIRMAETRAIVRALRFATNNSKVAKEEINK